MDFLFKGLPFFSGKAKQEKDLEPRMKNQNPYVKASQDLKKSVEELNRATRKLQQSFRQRQDALNNLVSIFNRVEEKSARRKNAQRSAPMAPQKKPQRSAGKKPGVSEAQLFEVYREACINFIETDKQYYFKLRNHSDFLCAVYKRHMGNLRYYDHEFRRLSKPEQFRFTEFEAYVANRVIQTVGKIGREKFVREGHQRLYTQLCSELLPKSVNQ